MLRDDSGNIPLASSDTNGALQDDAHEDEAPDPEAPGPSVPDYYTMRRACIRLIFFLSFHFIMFAAELSAMSLFGYLGCWGMCTLLVLPFTASGILCALAAWRSTTPKFEGLVGFGIGLPLSERSCLVGLLLAIPFGIFQLVIVVLELEAFFEWCISARQVARASHSPVSPSSDQGGEGLGLESQRENGLSLQPGQSGESESEGNEQWLDKFHCKAINGALEGLFASTVVYFGYFGLGFPSYNPILKTPEDLDFSMYKMILRVILIIASGNTGLCLLEIDFAVSNIKRGLKHELLHCLFRISEVTSRVTLFVLFAVLTIQHSNWWWVPLATDLSLVFILTDAYGGCERTVIIRLICMVPCAFANVFFFVDSPTKRRAARKLTVAFAYKNIIETIALPVLCYFCNPDYILSDFEALLRKDPFSVFVAVLTHPVYWGVFYFMYNRHADEPEEKDIFTACEEGDTNCVMSQMGGDAIDVDTYDTNGMTPLMLAVQRCKNTLDLATQHRYALICQILIENGAYIDRRIFDDGRFFWTLVQKPHRLRWTALHMAAYGGSTIIVKEMLDWHRQYDATTASAEGHFQDLNGDTPLHIAVRKGHKEISKDLAAEWPNWARTKNRDEDTPISIATSEIGDTILAQIDAPLRSIQQQNQPSQWVRLIINRTFIERPCHAPGLSSFLASSGGGTLGKVFLKPVPEDESFQETPSPNPSHSTNSVDAPEPLVAVSYTDIVPVGESGVICPRWQRSYGSEPFNVESFTTILRSSVAFLGKGAYGTVWRGKDTTTGRLFAVKNMQSQVRTSQREVKMAKSILLMPHPCIVGFYSVHDFPDSGFALLVMELCTGGNMQDMIATRRRELGRTTYSPPDLAWRWIGQIFLALEHFHKQMKILWRDLKPDNVVLSGEGVAKLTDFGFGRQGTQSNGAWTFDCPTGSPGFTAPEVFHQIAIDETCDLYSFGVLMWTLLTGGLISKPDKPQPPVATTLQSGSRFTIFVNDCLALKKCIEAPSTNDAVPLPLGSAKELVNRLIDKNSRRRPKHHEIRQNYSCIQDLRLPDLGSSRTEVETWLRNF